MLVAGPEKHFWSGRTKKPVDIFRRIAQAQGLCGRWNPDPRVRPRRSGYPATGSDADRPSDATRSCPFDSLPNEDDTKPVLPRPASAGRGRTEKVGSEDALRPLVQATRHRADAARPWSSATCPEQGTWPSSRNSHCCSRASGPAPPCYDPLDGRGTPAGGPFR